MFAKIWIWISSLFPKSKIGVIFSLLFARATTTFAKEVLDPTNQKVAYDFVKALHNDDSMTNAEKAKVFNQQMLKWAKQVNKKIADSVINCLRELAVNALKAEKENIQK